jgi:hypothetical protein
VCRGGRVQRTLGHRASHDEVVALGTAHRVPKILPTCDTVVSAQPLTN